MKSALVCPATSDGETNTRGWKELISAFRMSAANWNSRGFSASAMKPETNWLLNSSLDVQAGTERDRDTANFSDTKAASEHKMVLSLPGTDSALSRDKLREEAERALWWALGSAEMSSEHPLAKELVAVASAKARLLLTKPEIFENVTGVGLRCVLPGGLKVEVASASHIFAASKVDCAQLKVWADANKAEGATVIAVAVDEVPLACVSLRDTLAPHARACVAQLEMSGIEVWMCTGDHRQAAEVVARECGIDLARVVAEALPADKIKTVKLLQEGSNLKSQKSQAVVAMVGDGINDAPALAAADLGVAIGAGQNVTVDAADVVLVRTDLRDLLAFVALSKQTLQTIWFNFFWAFCFNISALPVAAGVFWRQGVHMTPQVACVLMLGSSLLVVFTSLLLKRFVPAELPCQV